MNLKIESTPGTQAGVTILRLSGPFTLQSVFEFQSLIRSLTDPVIIVDLTEVPFMDSAGLGAIMFLHTTTQKNQRRYALVGASKRLHNLFQIVGVDQILVHHATVPEAEAKLAGQGAST
jgi:anti-sigma B factor antagonist